MSVFTYLGANPTNVTAVNAEPIYGYPVFEEHYHECFPVQPTSAEYVANVIPSATVTCISADFQEAEAETLPVALSDTETDFFDGMIEILAEGGEFDSLNGTDLAAILSPVALPLAAETAQADFAYPAAFSYAVPEAKRIDYDEKAYEKAAYLEYEQTGYVAADYFDEKVAALGEYYYADCDYDFPIDCVAAFESMDMSENILKVEECRPAVTETAELFEIGTIDIDYLKSLNDSEDKRAKRKEAINRWKTKKSKRKMAAVAAAHESMKHAVKSSVSSISEAAAAACSSLLNARQKATAKRERQNGKFKKAQVQWVSVSELFNSSFGDDFK